MTEEQAHHPIKSIAEIRKDIFEGLNANGYCLIKNVNRKAVYEILQGLGELFQQEAGEEHFVEYHEGYDDFRYSRSLNEIGPHSEYPYYKTPPRIQVLYCVKPSDCQGGQTYTCNTDELLKRLSEAELKTIASITIDFKANTDLKDFQSKTEAFPVLSQKSDSSYIFRFSHNLFYYGDVNANVHSEERGSFLAELKNPDFQRTIEKFLDYFEANKQTWNIPKNGLLLWNNHNTVHWRASYTDKSRKLIRYLIA